MGQQTENGLPQRYVELKFHLVLFLILLHVLLLNSISRST